MARIIDCIPLIEELQKVTKAERIEFFRNPENFFLFWLYHYMGNFSCDLADFHFEWIHTLTMTDLSMLLE